MIPRLWVCTSHPWLVLLSFPLHPLGVYAALVLSTLATALGATWLAARLQHLWLTLLAVFATVTCRLMTVGTLLAWFDVNPNPLYVGARYAWVPLAWGATAWSLWGGRNVLVTAIPVRTPRYNWIKFGAALSCLGVLVAWPYVSSAKSLLTIPYRIAEFTLDEFNANRASDECNAARVAEYLAGRCLFCTPGGSAERTLFSRGVSARDGMAAYLEDRQIHPNPDSRGGELVVEMLAQYGKHPYFEHHDQRMAKCLNSGRQVKSGFGWDQRSDGWYCYPALAEDVLPQKPTRP